MNIIINQWAYVLCSVQYCDTSCLVQLMSHDSPYLAHQGQCVPPAVGQQHPHVPGLLHHGGPSPLTKCSHVCVCVSKCGEQREGGKGMERERGVHQMRKDDRDYSGIDISLSVHSCQQPFHACQVLFRMRGNL